MKTLLFEIGTEEIPARFLGPAKEGLTRLLEDCFSQSRIQFESITIQATPRRMAAYVKNVAEKQEETTITKFGPPFNRAFDADGQPTKAALGFAKSQGVDAEDLKKGIKDGVEFVTIEKHEKGEATERVLAASLPGVVSKIPFQKKMRWGAETFEYARPVQWIVCLFGDSVVEFPVADVVSGNKSWCHRFLSPGAVTVKCPEDYIDLLKEHYIVVDESERLNTVETGIARIEKEVDGQAIRDEELIREIIYITEYPYPLRGTFDDMFLELPKEVLVNVMKTHQRYIPIEGKDGKLMPCFIFFANTAPKEDRNVIRGNEKVLRARLADARFFFEEDRKVKLEDRYEKLSSIVFHVKLGTLKEKTERSSAVAVYLASRLSPELSGVVTRAARLMKNDLVTHMVGEFSELQGTMGRIYANIEGEKSGIAEAIEEHYKPISGTGSLPESALGAILSIADKIDSISSFFSVGLVPTGNLDPYALRRQSLGIIRIILDKKYSIPLEELIRIAYENGQKIKNRVSLEETTAKVTEFISTRFKFSMLDEAHNQDYIESVLPFVAQDVLDGYERLLTLESQQDRERFDRLMVGFRRVYNITKQLSGNLPVSASLFSMDEEKELYSLYESSRDSFFSAMKEHRYTDALNLLVTFKEPIDRYFEKVFVMDNDEAVRNNRLAALKNIRDMFLTFADFSKIRIE